MNIQHGLLFAFNFKFDVFLCVNVCIIFVLQAKCRYLTIILIFWERIILTSLQLIGFFSTIITDLWNLEVYDYVFILIMVPADM